MTEDEAIEIAGKYALSRSFFMNKFVDVLGRVERPTNPQDQADFDLLVSFIAGLHWRIRDAVEQMA